MNTKSHLVGILLLWLLGLAGPLNAQKRHSEFEFHHVQQKDGLASNMISCFLQDHDGFLWIGTYDGLNRFDGGQFFTFKSQHYGRQSLLNNTINDLCEDKAGNIWAATATGISCFEKNTGRFRNLTAWHGRRLGNCTNILCDRNGNIWFTSYYAGLFCYLTKTRFIRWFPFDAHDTLNSTRISLQGLIQDPLQNGLWVADKRAGLRYFDIDHQQFTSNPDHPQLAAHQQHYVTALTLDGHRLLFADETEEHIVVYDLEQKQRIRTLKPVSQLKPDPFDIVTVFVDRQHNLWVSSGNNTMFFVEANSFAITELVHKDMNPLSIAGSSFLAGWQHPDGSVWLGTVNGISYTNPERTFYTIYNMSTLLPALADDQGIMSFYEDTDGSWWLGTGARGLLHYQPQTNRLKVYKLPNATLNQPYGGPVKAILPYGNELIIGAFKAIFHFNRKTGSFTAFPTLPAFVRQEKKDMFGYLLQGDALWVSGQTQHIYRYSIPTRQWTSYPITPATNDPKFVSYFVGTDAHGDLWTYCYPDGMARFSASSGQFVVDKVSADSDYDLSIANTISSCRQDAAGNYWLASSGHGLLRYSPQTRHYSRLTESEGLTSDHCADAIPDRAGDIWVGAYNQFSVYTPATKRFLNFSLPINEANRGYSDLFFTLKNGHVLAAMQGYLVEFIPQKLRIRSAKVPSKVLIGQVDTGDTSMLVHKTNVPVRLEAGNEGFAVHFGTLSAVSQTPFAYVYQLEGYNDWTKIEQPTYVIYNKIPGGDYTFRIKGVAPDGQETPVTTMAVHINTVFYRTVWFWGLIALFLIGFGSWFIRYRTVQTARLHTLQVQTSRLERDKTEIQYQNLINHLNPHFLFNSLTSLNSLILTNPKEASLFLKKLSVIYRYILQNKDKDLVSLQEELAFAQYYIDLQNTRFGESLQIHITVDTACLTQRIVPVTIQNLLENAIKHNILSDDTPLSIQIYTENDTLYVANDLQKKSFVETSNKQGLASLKSLYYYLSRREVTVMETDTQFIIAIPLL